ncbi:acidic leucine-rich nuclear phosphoprotein 32 family member B-like [Anopheles nili]|uniref:acidic leucine-rich nuclear phosphoprotein 32 family member B-like n=1 Tax=Anopheles nili TaxID=185578 RepID=UPI00237BDD7B|nr:acidic leucine-rich nuclear phosphoprotein 32 family member B-like [Anopheles nili]
MAETQFLCDLCGQRYSTFEILMTHNRLKHYHTIKFGCGYCNETFRHEDDLYCHFVLTHHVDPYAKRRCDSAESDEDGYGQMRLISESDDGEEPTESSADDDDDEEEEDEEEEDENNDVELSYNELYVRRKQSAMTQEEISELTDEFKKSVQSAFFTKLRL